MSHSRLSLTRLKRSVQSEASAAVVVVAVVEVEVIVGVVADKTPKTRIKAVKVVRAVKMVNPPQVLVIRGPSIRICLLASGTGVKCTEDGGEGLISVPNPPLVLGRTYSLRSLQRTNESLTNPASVKLIQTELTICCIQ